MNGPGTDSGDSLRDQAAALGIPDADAVKWIEDDASSGHFEVFAENWPAVLVFLSCATQWRRQVPPMGGPLIHDGLIYSGVRDVIWSHGHTGKAAREIFGDVQIMEVAALAKLQQAANKS